MKSGYDKVYDGIATYEFLRVIFLQNIDLSQSMPNSPLPSTMPGTCRTTFLFLVLHGGKPNAKIYVVVHSDFCGDSFMLVILKSLA